MPWMQFFTYMVQILISSVVVSFSVFCILSSILSVFARHEDRHAHEIDSWINRIKKEE